MSSFIHVENPSRHAGAERAVSFFTRLGATVRRFDGARGMAALLLSAIVASMLVVADRIMSTNEEGGLLLAWVVLWGVAFIGLALFADTARSAGVRIANALRTGSQRRADARADAELLAAARQDSRMMAELCVIAAHRDAAF